MTRGGNREFIRGNTGKGVKEATSLSEATQVKTSGFKNEFIGKTTTMNKV